ncbi:LmeA family phospholipid-binding protein [Streptomyces sp. YS-B37]|uniref:LmeA family phospholipid-binding protein n=1 Tax=Streptomyces sp. YS-B37 TaxID=3407669 RepID=UPI003B5104C0
MNKRRRPYLTAGCVAALTLAVVGTDLLVERKAEERIAEAVECRLAGASDVHVELGSEFAGLRAVAGTVGTVHIGAEHVRHEGFDVALAANLYGVSTDGDATSGSAAATVAYAELGERFGSARGGMTPASDGTHLVLTGTAGKTEMPVTVVTDLSTTSHAVTITPSSVSVLGERLSVSALAAMPGASGVADGLKPQTIELGALPAGVRLTGASAATDGLVLRFALSPDELKKGESGGACASARKRA